MCDRSIKSAKMLFSLVFFSIFYNAAGAQRIAHDAIYFDRRGTSLVNVYKPHNVRTPPSFRKGNEESEKIQFVNDYDDGRVENFSPDWNNFGNYHSNTNPFREFHHDRKSSVAPIEHNDNIWNNNSPYRHVDSTYLIYDKKDEFHSHSNGNVNSDRNPFPRPPYSGTNSREKSSNKAQDHDWEGDEYKGKRTNNPERQENSKTQYFRDTENNSVRNTSAFEEKSTISTQNNNKRLSKRKLLPEDTCGIDLPRRILGGSDADIDEFPWMALLQYRDNTGGITHDCGGALISSRYVVTAAHCTIGLAVTTRKMKLQKVRLGEWDLSTEVDCQQEICNRNLQDIEIEEIINHENYNPRQKSQVNDIALLRLKQDVQMSQFVQPVCLPLDSVGEVNFEGKRLCVSGWGRTKNVKGSNSNIKQKVEVPVVTWEDCRRFYESFYSVKIEQTQMCAGGESGKDSCQGDSGGPLISSEKVGYEFRWFLAGIVSSGTAACGVEARPSIYTKVTAFTDWILDNMRD